jgi:hypothetical protein
MRIPTVSCVVFAALALVRRAAAAQLLEKRVLTLEERKNPLGAEPPALNCPAALAPMHMSEVAKTQIMAASVLTILSAPPLVTRPGRSPIRRIRRSINPRLSFRPNGDLSSFGLLRSFRPRNGPTAFGTAELRHQ